jgi:hypothetical protein
MPITTKKIKIEHWVSPQLIMMNFFYFKGHLNLQLRATLEEDPRARVQ